MYPHRSDDCGYINRREDYFSESVYRRRRSIAGGLSVGTGRHHHRSSELNGDSQIKQAVHQPTHPVSTNIANLLENFQNDEESKQMHSLLEKFADVFSTGLERMGKTSVVKADINVESSQVVAQGPYRVSEPKKEIVSRMVDELSTSEIASPVVLIKKPNGSDRMCFDYRRLNKLIKKENFPVPNMEARLQQAKRFKYFSSLDLNSGYYQIEIALESRKFTAFSPQMDYTNSCDFRSDCRTHMRFSIDSW